MGEQQVAGKDSSETVAAWKRDFRHQVQIEWVQGSRIRSLDSKGSRQVVHWISVLIVLECDVLKAWLEMVTGHLARWVLL